MNKSGPYGERRKRSGTVALKWQANCVRCKLAHTMQTIVLKPIVMKYKMVYMWHLYTILICMQIPYTILIRAQANKTAFAYECHSGVIERSGNLERR